MAKILMLIENGFEDMGAMYPYYRLTEAGFVVDVAGPLKGEYKGKYGYPIYADLSADEVQIQEYIALIIPGGQAPDRMRMNDRMVDLVKAADKLDMIIGAICHGPQMLIEADIIRNCNVTCFQAIMTDVLNAGAIYHDNDVIADGNIITSRKPADLPSFCQEIVARLPGAKGSVKNGGC